MTKYINTIYCYSINVAFNTTYFKNTNFKTRPTSIYKNNTPTLKKNMI